MKKILILLLLSWRVLSENTENTDVWVDPNDPTFSSQPTSSSLAVSTCSSTMNDQSLRLILRQMFHEMHVDYETPEYVQRSLQIKISKHAMTIITKYLKEELENTPETKENIRSSLANIFTVIDENELTWEDTFRTFQPYIFLLNMFILPAASVVVVRAIVKPRNFWIILVSTILLVSMYSGYNKKYQEAESRRFAQFQLFNNGNSEACAPETLVQRMFEIVASPFQYRQKSNCLKYIESQTISIFHEISIIEVFSETISSGFFSFFSATGKHINHFFKDLYDGAPIIAQIVMTVFLLLMIGTVRTPFFTYEPLLLTFGSSSVGKIVNWLEGKEEPKQLTINIEKVPEKEKIKQIECCKSESEDGKSIEQSEKKENKKKKRNKEETTVLEDHASEDEEEEKKDSETEWSEAKNSETSF